jgi:hypothetical protein
MRVSLEGGRGGWGAGWNGGNRWRASRLDSCWTTWLRLCSGGPGKKPPFGKGGQVLGELCDLSCLSWVRPGGFGVHPLAEPLTNG